MHQNLFAFYIVALKEVQKRGCIIKMLIHPLIEAKTRGARNEIGLFLDDACLSPLLYKSLDIGQSHCSLYVVVRREQVG